MNRIIPNAIAVFYIICSILLVAEADTSSSGVGYYPPPEYASLKPSLAVVIGILTIMFLLTFLLLVYAKFCHRPSGAEHINRRNQPTAVISSSDRFSGIDKTVIESLPFFRFSALKGSKEGLECSVCLSKFEDVEILRLLPKCKHAFHIDCIDHWLEKHSTCPLCRRRVGSDDLTLAGACGSSSMRFLRDDDSGDVAGGVELFVQREESRRGSSRFSVGSSFRKIEKKEETVSLTGPESAAAAAAAAALDKHRHKIIVSELFVMKNRWSNVTSSDLMFLNSEMLISENVGAISGTNNNINYDSSSSSRSVLINEQRSVSEITAVSRYNNNNDSARFGAKNNNIRVMESGSLREDDEKEERIRRVWLPIARRTVQWFANKQQRSQFPQNQQRQSLDV